MPTAKNLIIPSGDAVRSEAIQTLIKKMGITKAAIFIRENMAQKIDYLKAKDELFVGKSVARLYEEIKKRKK